MKEQINIRTSFLDRFGFLLMVLLSVVLGFVMLVIAGKENFEPLLKTTRYVLSEELGMGYYDTPNGQEQNVIYLEEGVSQVPKLNDGERLLHHDRLKVDKPSDGWAKVDIGDGGAPLYVEEQYVMSEEAPMFGGRRGDTTLFSIGVKNLPPSGLMWIMGLLIYAFLYSSWYTVFHWGFETEQNRKKIYNFINYIAYVGLAYFIILYILKFVCGYNLHMYWFVSGGYLESTMLSIVNVILGIIGCLGVAFLTYQLFLSGILPSGNFFQILKSFGWRRFFYIACFSYFLFMFLGVVVFIIFLIVGTILFMSIFRGVFPISSKKEERPANYCCRACGYFSEGWCQKDVKLVKDPDSFYCNRFSRGV